ncbi:hypothetical protein ABTZ78_00725 [Streptomyces bauhiniae]|uniref:hypothetical protein n=1 Tax=Streptomyces bauhiniae TaxID=2340725 RepID=UPI0033199482
MPLRHTPLVPADRLASPQSYRQLARSAADGRFREALEDLVGTETFDSLHRALAAEGAVSLTGLLPQGLFGEFRQTYDAEMRAKGSRGSLHSYLNVVSSAPLLRSPGLWETVAHPLLVVLVAHALGGPVKIVDLRAKDTYPVDVVARDNTLHLDNSPFMDEYKVVVTWTLGSVRGPSGQGLTYLPHTNRLFRQCFVAPDGSVWSDEDACIFPSRERVDEVLLAQAEFLDTPEPRVVHLTDLDMPCHRMFAASRLVHHRYRTSAGAPRSAVMASFHRTDDSDERLGATEAGSSPLQQFLAVGGSEEQFLDAVSQAMPGVEAALEQVSNASRLVVDPRQHLLTGQAFEAWYARQCAGVTLNNLRARRLENTAVRHESSAEQLVQRLQYDLQGPLNMPFFADMRETRRKRARIWLRELSPEAIREVVATACARSVNDVKLPLPTSPGGSIAELRSLLLDLHLLLPRLGTGIGSDGSADGLAVNSLPSFIGDLKVTASWLDDSDTDSLITATAFAALGSALCAQRFGLGADGEVIARRLLRNYMALVDETTEPVS